MTVAAPVSPRPVLTFEEEPHIYRIDGRIVPSVTQILKAVWPEIWPWASEFAMERGRKVHQAAHLWILGDLDSKRLSPYIAGFVAGAIRFLQETGFEFAQIDGSPASECRMYSSIYDYAGTADWIGTYQRKSAVIDLKTGEPGWACGPQTWAYSQQWQEMTGEVVRQRFGLHLYDDGTYQLVPYKDHRNDQADFLAALRVEQRRVTLAPKERNAA